MTRYALLQSDLMPVAHAAVVDPTGRVTTDGALYQYVARLCTPAENAPWEQESIPYIDEERLTQVMEGPNACGPCARAWRELHHPATPPATVHDADELGTASLLDLL